MMSWLPRGFQIERGITVGRLLSCDDEWQLCSTSGRGFAVVVVPSLFEKWKDISILPADLFTEIDSSQGKLYVAVGTQSSRIISVKFGPYPDSYDDAAAFAIAMNRSRAAISTASFDDGLFFEKYSLILPTYGDGNRDDSTVLCSWIASGVELSPDRFDRLCSLVSWMSPSSLAGILKAAGFAVSQDDVIAIENSRVAVDTEEKAAVLKRSSSHEVGEHFSLPGRPMLESFFNEHVVDIIRNSERYKRMGIDFPSAILLHGPPGCGKTFAVEKLVGFLGWPSFNIDSGSIGSPFIHDTSKKISEVFDNAISAAPSVIVIDEMEAFLSARDFSGSSGQHHVEEVAEFLRRIPEATSKNVLVI